MEEDEFASLSAAFLPKSFGGTNSAARPKVSKVKEENRPEKRKTSISESPLENVKESLR